MSGLFLTRYVGAFSLGAAALYVCWRGVAREGCGRPQRPADFWPRALCAAAAIFAAAGLMAGYLALNVAHTGHLTGMPRGAASAAWPTVAMQAAGALAREGQALLCLALAAAPAALLAWRQTGLRFVGSEGAGDPLPLACALTGACYLASICALRGATEFDDFGYRLLYPGTFLLVTAGAAALAGKLRADLARTFDSLPRKRVAAYLLLLVAAGPHVLQAELALRERLGVGAPKGKPAAAEVASAVLERFRSVPPGSVVLVDGYLCDDYLAGFLRPDLVVHPLGMGAYGERLQFPGPDSRLFVERRLASVQTQYRVLGEAGDEAGPPFVEVARPRRGD